MKALQLEKPQAWRRIDIAEPAAPVESVLNLKGNSQLIGEALYTNYLLPFEIASILLLVAITVLAVGWRHLETQGAALLGAAIGVAGLPALFRRRPARPLAGQATVALGLAWGYAAPRRPRGA